MPLITATIIITTGTTTSISDLLNVKMPIGTSLMVSSALFVNRNFITGPTR